MSGVTTPGDFAGEQSTAAAFWQPITGGLQLTLPAQSVSSLSGSIPTASPTPTPAAEVASIEMSPSSLTLTVGDGGALIVATARDANGAVIPNVMFYWESRDTQVVRVDQSGLVTGVAAGSTTVVAIAPNGRHNPATVTVLAATPTPTLTLAPSTILPSGPLTRLRVPLIPIGTCPPKDRDHKDGAIALIRRRSKRKAAIAEEQELLHPGSGSV